MKVSVSFANKQYQVDTSVAHSLAISVDFINSDNQPNHFGAVPAQAKPMQAGGFIGDTKKGGSCNVNELTLNPHCNGTHTETIAHICHTASSETKGLVQKISDINIAPLMPCPVISLTPLAASSTNEHYSPDFEVGDMVISQQQLETQLSSYNEHQLQCLAIRTLPNQQTKCQASYNESNQPAFFTREAILYLNKRGVEHLILDIPSLDRLNDDGLLTCHHLFWQVPEGEHAVNAKSLPHKTITEMAYIDNAIEDGFYFINLQTPAFVNDAAPSRPVLYNATEGVF